MARAGPRRAGRVRVDAAAQVGLEERAPALAVLIGEAQEPKPRETDHAARLHGLERRSLAGGDWTELMDVGAAEPVAVTAKGRPCPDDQRVRS